MALLELTLAGDPVPKGRPRSGQGRHYTPTRTRDAQERLAWAAKGQLGPRQPTDAPVGIAVQFFCATRRRADGDNMMKLVTDALNGIAYTDDSQILEWFIRVERGVGASQARTEIMLWMLT